jgi:hypothetical protein
MVRKGGFGVAVVVSRGGRRTRGNKAKMNDRRAYRLVVGARMALFFAINGVGSRLVHPTANTEWNVS